MILDTSRKLRTLTFDKILYLCWVLGTPATVSQLAKDVCTFLKWAAGENKVINIM